LEELNNELNIPSLYRVSALGISKIAVFLLANTPASTILKQS